MMTQINSFYLHKESFRIESIIFRSGLAHAECTQCNSFEYKKSFYISVLVVYSLSEVRCVLGAQKIAALKWYVTAASRLSHISLLRISQWFWRGLVNFVLRWGTVGRR